MCDRSTLETQPSLPQRGCVTLGKALTLSEPRLSCAERKGIRSFIHSRSQLVSRQEVPAPVHAFLGGGCED